MLGLSFLGALPPHLARLYAGVDDATALESSRCSRSEDVHVCPAAAGTGPLCETSLGAARAHAADGPTICRPRPVYAQHGMAATSCRSPRCALDMLKAGGTAVDGAIAANLCEGVVEPMMSR